MRMTSSNSSSFIRIRRLSRVTPALLTRMSSLPPSASTACGTRLVDRCAVGEVARQRNMIAAQAGAEVLQLLDVAARNGESGALARERFGDRASEPA